MAYRITLIGLLGVVLSVVAAVVASSPWWLLPSFLFGWMVGCGGFVWFIEARYPE